MPAGAGIAIVWGPFAAPNLIGVVALIEFDGDRLTFHEPLKAARAWKEITGQEIKLPATLYEPEIQTQRKECH